MDSSSVSDLPPPQPPPPPPDRLSDIPSEWTEVIEIAKRPSSDPEARAKQAQLLEQYGPAIQRYLYAALHNQDDVRNVFQELAVRLAEGKFGTLDRTRGKFRRYLKTVLYRLVIDHYNRKAIEPIAMLPEELDPAASTEVRVDSAEEQAARFWRTLILNRCWLELKAYEESRGKPYYSLLDYKIKHDKVRARVIGRVLADRLGGPKDEQQVRKLLLRARRRFANLLIDAVESTLRDPTYEELEAEIIDLRLHNYVGKHLAERRR